MTRLDRWRDEKGFQLLKLTLVCGLITSVLTLGWAGWDGVRNRYRLESGRLEFLAAATQARHLAVVKGIPMQIGVKSDRLRYTLAVPQDELLSWRQLPQGVRFDSIPGRVLTFYSRGSAAPAGTFLLGNRSGQVLVIVAPSGRIRWERVP